jgi:hypothetical protein
MSDDLNRRAPEDPTKINVNQQWELDYWSKELEVSKETLRAAVSSVGPMVRDVQIYLLKDKEL